MIFDLGTAKIKTTLSTFNLYVLSERREGRAQVLLMSHNTFDEINLLSEIEGESNSLEKIVQLSKDDDCTVFCGIKTAIENNKYLSVAVAHKGRLYDIANRAINLSGDLFSETDKIKIYNSSWGKTAIMIDSDATLDYLWKKINVADFVFCFLLTDSLNCEATRLAVKYKKPTVIISSAGAMLIKN